MVSVSLALALILGHGGHPAKLAPNMVRLKSHLDGIANQFHGRMGYYLKNLKTGEVISSRGDERFPSASTIKTVIMIEALKQIEEGKLKWTDKLTVPPKGQRNMSMWTAYLLEGTAVNIDGLVNLMMNVSDNTATVMLAGKVGVENIERRMLDWGFQNTVCTIREPATNARLKRLHGQFGNMGVTSPRDMGEILEKIYRATAASPTSCERMVRIMSHQYWDDFFTSQLPPTVTVCSKVGALERSRSDTAIVFGPTPYILTAYTDDGKDRSWGNDCEAHVSLRKMSAAAWAALNPSLPYTPKKDAERLYPTGGGVEDS